MPVVELLVSSLWLLTVNAFNIFACTIMPISVITNDTIDEIILRNSSIYYDEYDYVSYSIMYVML